MAALANYDRNEFEESIRAFQPIADTSKILFNCGVIRATLGEHEPAVCLRLQKHPELALGVHELLLTLIV